MGNLVGLVFYKDDPTAAIFRAVYLTGDDKDSELDNPRWVTEGCDPSRVAVMKVMAWADYEDQLRQKAKAEAAVAAQDAALADLIVKAGGDVSKVDPSAKSAIDSETAKQQLTIDTVTAAVLFTGSP